MNEDMPSPVGTHEQRVPLKYAYACDRSEKE